MKTYQLIEVGNEGRDIYLICSHKLDFTDLIGAIRKSVPSAQITEYKNNIGFKVENLKELGSRVRWVIITWLCNNSFEPFVVYASGLNNYEIAHCFRREVQNP